MGLFLAYIDSSDKPNFQEESAPMSAFPDLRGRAKAKELQQRGGEVREEEEEEEEATAPAAL